MYHRFRVSPDRVRTNSVALVLSTEEARRFPWAWKQATRLGSAGEPWLAAFATLPMGDGVAVDSACRSHMWALGQAGVLEPSRRVRSVWPLPRSPVLELLVIDDWVSILRRHLHDRAAATDMEARVDAAAVAYDAVGLERNAEKQVRRAKSATVLGAWLDGESGLLSASSDKLLRVSELSLALSRCRVFRGDVVRRVISNWVFVLGFARHRLALFTPRFDGSVQSKETASCVSSLEPWRRNLPSRRP